MSSIRIGERESGRMGDRPRTGRLATIVVLIVALLGTMGTRMLADKQRAGPLHITTATGASQSLGSLNSFTLAMLLGGLRGPLIMVLWTSSEESKNQKQLEDFDTKLEFIRMLQPEFRRVHIFQMWNKAYNISVQRASKANKYADILDAIEYGEKVGQQLHNDINIIAELGRLWGDKLGGDMQQKPYYFRRVREETKWRVLKDNAIRRSGAKPLELAPRLDAQGNILPQLRDQKLPDGTTKQGELHYLVPLEPFPDGIPPLGMGYNYVKWAQVLQSDFHQKHLDMGSGVISSRPAMKLKEWAQDELDRGRRLEFRALVGEPIRPDLERKQLQMLTAADSLSAAINDRAALDEALRNYARVQQLYEAALKEYARHIQSEFGGDEWTYRSHIDDVEGERALAAGDEAYLRAMLATGEARKAQETKAAEAYQKALDQFRRIVLKYYVDDLIALPLYQKHPGGSATTRPVVSQMTSAQLERTFQDAMIASSNLQHDPNQETQMEYEGFLRRAMIRLALLRGEAVR